jgi:hypothetical protein
VAWYELVIAAFLGWFVLSVFAGVAIGRRLAAQPGAGSAATERVERGAFPRSGERVFPLQPDTTLEGA